MTKYLLTLLPTAIYLFMAGCATAQASETTPGWKIEFRESGSNPVIADGVLYVGSADGAVYALDPGTGKTKWRFQTGEGLSSWPAVITAPRGTDPMAAGMSAAEKQRERGISRVDMTPAIENETVFIGSGDRSFYAIDAVTGKKKWSYLAGPGMASNNFTSLTKPAALLNSGTVYFTTENGLHALDALTGKEKWLFETLQEVPKQKFQTRKRDAEGPVVGDGALFLTAWPYIQGNTPLKSFLYAVDPESGKAKWIVSVDGLRITAPATAKGLALFAVDEQLAIGARVDRTTLYAINAVDGQVKWKFSAEMQRGTQPLLIADNTIYFRTEKSLFALELETGRRLWSFSEDEIRTPLKSDDQHVYVITHAVSLGRSRSTIHALALASGQKKWSRNLGGSAGNVMIHSGVVYAGYLYAIDASTGKELRSFSRTERESARLISGGRIFLTSPHVTYIGSSRVDQGYLYAIDARTGKLEP